MTSAQIVPVVVVPFIAWRVYVRVRRNVGPQRLQTGRITVRIAFLTLVTALIATAAFSNPSSLMALGGGLLLALPLALIGLHLTRFETTADGKSYTPNTAVGVALTALLVGRILYRLVVLFAAPPPDGTPPPAVFQSPVTLLVFGVTAGYYIIYYIGVLVRARKLN